ncbi:MAG: dTMP kinase [Verrucomicrobiales bacterium]|nr:dTMP kinase [Verrucomicrobiales bacterium]
MSIRLPGGFLLVIEGIDGAGKSTQANALAHTLADRGLDVVQTREPTDGPWGRRIRESATTGRMTPQEELNAFIQDRKQHVAELIRPGLAEGKVVVMDRYYFSTVAYQGARGLDPAELLRLNESFAVEPDLLVVIDLPAEVGLKRVGHRDGAGNEFETLTQLTRSREIFRSLQKSYLVELDGTLSPDTLRAEMLAAFHRAARRKVADRPGGSDAERQAVLRAIDGVACTGTGSTA